jgi:hypothetical protein
MSTTEMIERQAMAELAEEERQTAIAEAKQRIRERKMRPLWHRIFPFVITITRR